MHCGDHSPKCTQPGKKYRGLTSPKPHLKHDASNKPQSYTIKLLLNQTSTTNPNPPIWTQHLFFCNLQTHTHVIVFTHTTLTNLTHTYTQTACNIHPAAFICWMEEPKMAQVPIKGLPGPANSSSEFQPLYMCACRTAKEIQGKII